MNHIILVTILAVASLSVLPTIIKGTAIAVADKDELPRALPLTQQIPQLTSGASAGGGEIWQEDDREVLIRNERGTKNQNGSNGSGSASSCRYTKSAWTECDAKTNTRSRTLTLKKGEEACVQTRTIQKKCKKACRYEKGTWSECQTGQMSRTDRLKSTSDPTCQTTRIVNKNCNVGKSKDKAVKDRKNNDKGNRKGRA